MRNIVLYALLMFLILLPEAAGQKPVIELLPSDHERIVQYVWTDTSNTGDTLLIDLPEKEHVRSVHKSADSSSRLDSKIKRPDKEYGKPGHILKRRSESSPARGNSLNRLLLVIIRPNRFLF